MFPSGLVREVDDSGILFEEFLNNFEKLIERTKNPNEQTNSLVVVGHLS